MCSFLFVCHLASPEEDEGGNDGDTKEDGDVGYGLGLDSEKVQRRVESGEVREN